MKKLLTLGIAAALSGIVVADSRGINFEPWQGYMTGSIQNQPSGTPPPAGWGA